MTRLIVYRIHASFNMATVRRLPTSSLRHNAKGSWRLAGGDSGVWCVSLSTLEVGFSVCVCVCVSLELQLWQLWIYRRLHGE